MCFQSAPDQEAMAQRQKAWTEAAAKAAAAQLSPDALTRAMRGGGPDGAAWLLATRADGGGTSLTDAEMRTNLRRRLGMRV